MILLRHFWNIEIMDDRGGGGGGGDMPSFRVNLQRIEMFIFGYGAVGWNIREEMVRVLHFDIYVNFEYYP